MISGRDKKMWDVAVIGGGPAGMMAAGRAAETGAKVVLIEKNASLGRKLLITGGGRCNVTNAEFDTRKFLAKFGDSGKFLFSAFAKFGVKDTLDFFHNRKMPTKVEEGGRVFPESDKASSVWNAFIDYMKKGEVKIILDSAVAGFIGGGDFIKAIRLKDGREISAKSFILATGGKSRPETGSTGDGFIWAKKLGHTVVEPSASLVPVAVKDAWVKSLQGVTLSDVKLTVLQDGARQAVKKGRILFTHFGVSGPMVLNASREIGELLKHGPVVISIDLFPSLDQGALNKKLTEILKERSNRQFKNLLASFIPSALIPVLIGLTRINPETFGHSITREERLEFGRLLKNIPMNVKGLLGADKAIITSGGVALTEVDFKTMKSKKFANLYFVGDVLDIDRPSGGYSLQLCWTTGFVAGDSAGRISRGLT